ncbi:phosphatase [Rapidithrix thailandica]|uniref:Phosphatase n=1 Tax=Rapidithrix thailandica TaxID=413964 RepID=A0AAW9S2G9_9BACT
MENIQNTFEQIGGTFVTSIQEIARKKKKIKAFLFDWDGVFNAGYKGEGASSLFAEADSMATNLIRFNYWFKHRELPFTGIITGENNQSAIQLSKRERFQAVYFKIKNKADALKDLEERYGVLPEEVCYFFDDVLDLPIAKVCGLRVLLNRTASPVFKAYMINNQLCDYITAHSGGEHGVREAGELLLSIDGSFNTVVEERLAYSENYQQYIAERNAQVPEYFIQEAGAIQPHQL